jgi:hypothetical protein
LQVFDVLRKHQNSLEVPRGSSPVSFKLPWFSALQMVRCRRAKGQKTRTTQGGPSGRHASRIGERAAHRVAMQMKRDRSKMTAASDHEHEQGIESGCLFFM